jgi:hypothetical protein
MYKFLTPALLFCSIALFGQERLSLHGFTGIALPYTDVRDLSYTGINHNISLGTGLGYFLSDSKTTRLRFDLLGGKMAASDQSIVWDNQFFETSASIEYNILSLLDESSKLQLNLRAGIGMAIFTARAIDRQSRQLLQELPVNFHSQNAFEWGNFALLGANFGLPISERLVLNMGYNHRFMFSQNLDAIPNSSNDNFGIVTIGFTASLQSGKNPKMVEVDPIYLNELKTKVSVYEDLEKERESERLARIEMQNEELRAQIQLLKENLDTIQSVKISGASTTQSSSKKDNVQRAARSDEKYRVVIASVSSVKAAERFLSATPHASINDVEILYFEDLNTYRVITLSTSDISQARNELSKVREHFADAWIARF